MYTRLACILINRFNWTDMNPASEPCKAVCLCAYVRVQRAGVKIKRFRLRMSRN